MQTRSVEALGKTLWGASALTLRSDPLLRQSGILFLAMLLLHLANWLYHIVMSRALGTAEYGGLSALLGLLLLFSVPVHAVQMGVSAFVARGSAERAVLGSGLAFWVRAALVFGLAAAAALIFLSPWLSGVLGLASSAPIVVAAIVLLPWSVLPFLRGWLQGHQRPAELGASLVVEGLLKLAVGILLVRGGMGQLGAIAGVSLGGLGALLLTLPALGWARVEIPQRADAFGSLVVSIYPYLLAVGSFSILTQADVVLVKAIFPPHEAGLYAAASTAGKVILYITAPLSMVILPEMVRRNAPSVGGRRVAIRGAWYAGLLGGAGAVLFLLAPVAVIRVVFGPQYLDAAPLLGLLGLGMLAYALALFGIFYSLAAGDRGVLIWTVTPALLFPPLVLAVGKSLSAVALLVFVLGTFTCAAVWWRRPKGGYDAAD